jgi:hypothetical protein
MMSARSAIIPMPTASTANDVVQPIQPLLHDVFSAHPRGPPNNLFWPCLGYVCWELGGKSSVVLFMNAFSVKLKRGIAIAVALIGAAVTLGFAIWQSQKGRHQVSAIIDTQHALGGQR